MRASGKFLLPLHETLYRTPPPNSLPTAALREFLARQKENSSLL
jgi:hypothetical protein